MRTTIASAVLIIAPMVALATEAPPTCSLTDQQFSEQLDALDTWEGIYSHQQRHFPPCADDGLHAQAHSELIVRTLSGSWNQLPELAVIAQRNKVFRDFVFRHINAKSAKGDLQTILTNSTIRCPRGHASFCKDVRAAVAVALQTLQ